MNRRWRLLRMLTPVSCLSLAWPAPGWADQDTRPVRHPRKHAARKTVAKSEVRCNGNHCEVDRALVDRYLADTSELVNSARVVPEVQGGQSVGFKFFGIRPGSIFDRLGFRNADLLKSVNGIEVANPIEAMAAYAALLGQSHITVYLLRGGHDVNLDYDIR